MNIMLMQLIFLSFGVTIFSYFLAKVLNIPISSRRKKITYISLGIGLFCFVASLFSNFSQ